LSVSSPDQEERSLLIGENSVPAYGVLLLLLLRMTPLQDCFGQCSRPRRLTSAQLHEAGMEMGRWLLSYQLQSMALPSSTLLSSLPSSAINMISALG
jgi:hypothetical protein